MPKHDGCNLYRIFTSEENLDAYTEENGLIPSEYDPDSGEQFYMNETVALVLGYSSPGQKGEWDLYLNELGRQLLKS